MKADLKSWQKRDVKMQSQAVKSKSYASVDLIVILSKLM